MLNSSRILLRKLSTQKRLSLYFLIVPGEGVNLLIAQDKYVGFNCARGGEA